MLTHQTSDYPPSYLQKLPYFSSHQHHATLFTSDRRQSKTLIISTNVSQKSLETEFSNAICCSTVDKWQTKTLFLAILEPRSSIVKSIFECRLSGVLFPILWIRPCYANQPCYYQAVSYVFRHTIRKKDVSISNSSLN